MSNALIPRWGGPMGRYARREGVWFDPGPWAFLVASLVWLGLFLRQLPCVPKSPTDGPNVLVRLCYSEIPLTYSQGIGQGLTPYRSMDFEYPTLVGWFAKLAGEISRLLGAPVGASAEQLYAGSKIFLGVNAVLLFGCFLVSVGCHLLLGRDSAGRLRSWDGVLVAASPVVFLAGLIDWDLLAVAFVAAALLAWTRQHLALAGLLLGLGISTKMYPVVVLIALIILLARAKRWSEVVRLVLPAIGVWLAVNLVPMWANFAGWAHLYRANAAKGPGVGSLWYLLELMGVRWGPLGWWPVVLAAGGIGAFAIWAHRVHVAPRVGQLAFLLVAVVVLTNPMYLPQHAMWLWPLLVLARPRKADLVAFALAEVVYYLAVSAHLAGHLSAARYGPHRLYWAALLLHVGVLVWICVRVIRDVQQPWRDQLRRPLVGDPLAGVLADGVSVEDDSRL